MASRRGRSTARFRRDLDLLYQRGCRPITVSQLVDADVDVPSGMSAVVVTFDDASPGQFRFAEKDGRTEVDPESAVGIWLAFNRAHPDSKNRATFCLIPAGREGHAFFGDKGIEGRKTAWRFEKLQFLVREGFELCARTLWHADLSKADDHAVQEQIARSVLAIDSAVPGYRVRTFALPLGIWPRNRALATAGAWREPRSGREAGYSFDAVLNVGGPSVPGPRSPSFNPLALTRVQVIGDAPEHLINRLDATNARYVAEKPTATIRPRTLRAGKSQPNLRQLPRIF